MRPFFNFPLVLLGVLGLALCLGLLFIFIQIGMITVAFAKLGLTTFQAFAILFATLAGSGVNIPLMRTRQVVKRPVRSGIITFGPHGMVRADAEAELVDQVIAVNLGGCIIPCLLSLHFVSQVGFSAGLVLATATVTALCYALARHIPGKGIGIPVLLPPVATALAALLLAKPGQSAHVAYVAGSLGVLIGADILHLLTPRTRNALDAAVLSIGGAGTFDGIFITGIIAVLLA